MRDSISQTHQDHPVTPRTTHPPHTHTHRQKHAHTLTHSCPRLRRRLRKCASIKTTSFLVLCCNHTVFAQQSQSCVASQICHHRKPPWLKGPHTGRCGNAGLCCIPSSSFLPQNAARCDAGMASRASHELLRARASDFLANPPTQQVSARICRTSLRSRFGHMVPRI
jgi:hypothetical protein